MIGAIIGDIVGSKYEFNGIKTKDFPLFSAGCDYTDDTIMTVAVANALLLCREDMASFQTTLISELQRFGKQFPCPTGGYGNRFSQWLRSTEPAPYNSYGNGSAMRVSPCAYIAATLDDALLLAKAAAGVTHNHPEGIKGAQAAAGAVYLALHGKTKDDIRSFIAAGFYGLGQTIDELRPAYRFHESCQETVPQAIQAFLESESLEDALRNAVSLGGDSDTIAAITGSIAWAFYYPHWPEEKLDSRTQAIYDEAMSYLPAGLKEVTDRFFQEIPA